MTKPEQPQRPKHIQLEDGTQLEVVGDDQRKSRKRKIAHSRFAYHVRRWLLIAFGIVIPLIVGVVITWLLLRPLPEPAPVVQTAQAVRPTLPPTASPPPRIASVNEAQSLLLASNADEALASYQNDLALSLALQAAQMPDPYIRVQESLFRAVFEPGTKFLFRDEQMLGLDGDIAVSADGTQLLAMAGGFMDDLWLWNTQTGELIQTFDTTQYAADEINFQAAAFHPDGRRVVLGGYTRTEDRQINAILLLLDLESDAVIRTYEGHTGPVAALAISPDGQYLLSGGSPLDQAQDFSIRYWSLETGEQIDEFHGHDQPIINVQFMPGDSSQFVSSASNGVIIQWDIPQAQPVRQLFHDMLLHATDIHPFGHLVMTGNWDNSLDLWELSSQRLANRYLEHSDAITTVRFDPRGTGAASGSWDGYINYYDLTVRDELGRLVNNTRRLRVDNRQVKQIKFSPDGRYLFSLSSDMSGATYLRMWHIHNSNQLLRHDFWCACLNVLDVQSNRMAVGLDEGEIHILDTATLTPITHFSTGSNPILSVALSPDANLVASATFHGLDLWSATTGEHIRQFEVEEDPAALYQWPAFTPDGQHLITIGRQGFTSIWNVQTGEIESRMRVPEFPFATGLALNASGTQALSVLTNVIAQFDLETGTEINRFMVGVSELTTAAFSPDERLVVGGLLDGRLLLWDAASGEQIRQLVGHPGEISKAVFTPNGRYLISASKTSRDNLILWDVESGDDLYRFPNLFSAITDLALSSDGNTLYTTSSDGTVRAWYIPNSLEQLVEWATQNRYVPLLTCDQRLQNSLEPCTD